MSSLKSSSSSSVAIKPGQHRIDSIADHAASMIMSEEETIVTPNKTKLTKKNLEALSTQDAYSVRCPKNLVCSPTNSLCSQSTALSRARTEIEGRRKSRAAARARASAALDEIQSRNKDAKEKAWAALEQIQRSRSFGSRIGSMKSSSNEEEEERRQPVSLNFNQVDETREENEDRVGQVIMVKSPSSKSKKHAEKADVNEKKVRYQENEKTSKERRKRGTRRPRDKSVQHKDSNKEKTVPTEPSTNNFVFTEEALLAVSQAALEVAVSPKSLETIASVDEKDELGGDQDENTGMDPDGIVSTDAAADLQSLASSKAKSKTSKSTSSPMLSEADVFAVSLAALDVSTQMDSFPVEDEHMIIDKYGILDDVSGMNDVSSTPFVSTASEASTQPYTKDAQRKSSSSTVVSEMSKFDQNSTAEGDRMETSVFTTEERKEIAEEPTPRVSNSSPVPPPERALSPVAVETASLSPDDVKAPTSVQNDATLKSEEESTRASSGSSSSWENENEQTDNEQQSIEKKPSEIDKEMGALDSMMFQKKGLGQLNNAKPPPAVETGLTTNSEYSGHSSYSSDDMTNDLTLNKSMGPVWQKALNDAQKTLHPKSDKKSEGMLHVDDGSVADDDTVFSAKPGFNRERLQSVASFGVLFLLMNSLFVILAASSFAIRVFGLVGLISATFPLMVMCMYLMSSKTQHSFWLCSIKMLLIGSLCQVCTLILFICLEIGAGAGAVGFISLASLLALTVEMNTNSPVSIKPGKGDTPQLMIGDMMKCLVLFGLSPADEHESNQRRLRRKKKNSRLLDRTLDEDDAGIETKQQRSSESYMPPDIV